MNTMTKLYSSMTPAERARIDAEEDRREARKAGFVGADTSLIDIFRSMYVQRRDEARKAGFTGNFAHACIAANGWRVPTTPEEWSDAADGALSTIVGYDITNICLDDSQIG